MQRRAKSIVAVPAVGLVMLAVLPGCRIGLAELSALDTGGDSSINIDATDVYTTTVVPQIGHWTYSRFEVIETNCSNVVPLLPLDDEGYKIEDASSQVFTMRPDSIDQSLDCQLNGPTYDCEPLQDTSTPFEELVADLITTASISGRFTDEANDAGEYDITVSCSGADCTSLEEAVTIQFPCTFLVEFDALRD